jgi:DNA-binding LacI/PurR family transcriptional regulator
MVMAIDPARSIPLYRQPGDQIASNAALAKEYSVSLITVKNALSDLIKDGYLYGRVGKGTFVADPAQFAAPPSAGNLGFVLTDFSNPFFTGVLHHIESRVIDFGYRLLVSYSSNSTEKEEDQIRNFKEMGVKGLIIASTEYTNRVSESIYELHHSHFPYVVISYVEDPFIHYVGSDHEQGAFLATEFLMQCGCRLPGFINAEKSNPLGKLRKKGFIKSLETNDAPYRSEFEFNFSKSRQDYQSGYEIGRQFLSMTEHPDGIFAFNDQSAAGFERAVTDAGLEIPRDVALVGFDDVEWKIPPPIALTTIRQPADEIGLQTMLMLKHQIDEHDFSPRKILKPSLIIRQSCYERMERTVENSGK